MTLPLHPTCLRREPYSGIVDAPNLDAVHNPKLLPAEQKAGKPYPKHMLGDSYGL